MVEYTGNVFARTADRFAQSCCGFKKTWSAEEPNLPGHQIDVFWRLFSGPYAERLGWRGDSFHRCGVNLVKVRRCCNPSVATATPIISIAGFLDPFRERGIRPRMRAGCQGVFDGIVVDVVEMTIQVILVANDMLPKSALPYAAPAVSAVGRGDGAFMPAQP